MKALYLLKALIFVNDMPKFRKFFGSFRQVSHAIGIPSLSQPEKGETPQAKKENYLRAIRGDLRRFICIDFSHTVEQVYEKLEDTSFYNEKKKPVSFTQGGFNGTCFTELIVTSSSIWVEGIGKDFNEDVSKKLWRSIGINYPDKDGVRCAFAITYVRDDRDVRIPLHERKLYPAIAIIHKVNAPVDDRKVTLFIHPELLPAPDNLISVKNGYSQVRPTFPHTDLMKEISEALDSPLMSQLIQGLIVNDTVSLYHFNELARRLKTKENLDNRDVKKKQMQRMLDIASKPLAGSNKPMLQRAIKFIQEEINNEVEFFNPRNFEIHLTYLFNAINNRIGLRNNQELRIANEFTFYQILIELLADEQCKISRKPGDESDQKSKILLNAKDQIGLALLNPEDEEAIRTAQAIVDHYKEQQFGEDDDEEVMDAQAFLDESKKKLMESTPPMAPVVPSLNFLQWGYVFIGGSVISVFTIGAMALVSTSILAPLGVAFAGFIGLLTAAKLFRDVKEEKKQYQLAYPLYEMALKTYNDVLANYRLAESALEEAEANVNSLRFSKVNDFTRKLLQISPPLENIPQEDKTPKKSRPPEGRQAKKDGSNSFFTYTYGQNEPLEKILEEEFQFKKYE